MRENMRVTRKIWLAAVSGFHAGCLILLFGCSDAAAPESHEKVPVPQVAISPAEHQTYLESGLSSLSSELAVNPIQLSDPAIVANEFGQEMLSVNYSRPVVVRTMAAEVTLVLLSPSGERRSVYVQPGILIQPQDKGTLNGILSGVLDHRGRLAMGHRAFLEMRAATMNGTSTTAERVSDVVWIGNQEQLISAMQTLGTETPSLVPAMSPVLQAVPSQGVARGTPLWMRTGDSWTRGYAMENKKDGEIRLLIYLVRRDRPFLPWVVAMPKPELRMEEKAITEFQANLTSFSDLGDTNELKLSRHGVPNELKHLDESALPVGTEVLDFWNGMLDPCTTTSPPQNGTVAIQRIGLDNAQMVKYVRDLYYDPMGERASK